MHRVPDIGHDLLRWAGVVLLLGACPRAGVAHAQESAEPPVRVEAHAAAWLRLELDDAGDVGLTIPLFRPSLTVSLLEGRVLAYVRPELAGDAPSLLDAYLDLERGPALRVRIGRFKTPFSRLWTTSTTSLELPDRGVVVDAFSVGRALGVMASGQAMPVLRYDLGVFAADVAPGLVAPMLVARFHLAAYGTMSEGQTPSLTEDHPSALSIAVNGYYRGGAGDVTSSLTGGLDAQIVEGPFTVLAEGFVRRHLDEHGMLLGGVVVQASLFFIPRWAEVVVRGNWLIPPHQQLTHTYEAGITVHLPLRDVAPGEHVKLVARYRFSAADSAHDGILQAQLAF